MGSATWLVLGLLACAPHAQSEPTERPERTWTQQDIQDAVDLHLLPAWVLENPDGDRLLTLGELAVILLEARPYLHGLEGPPGPPGAQGSPGRSVPYVPASAPQPPPEPAADYRQSYNRTAGWVIGSALRYSQPAPEYGSGRSVPVSSMSDAERLAEQNRQLEETIRALKESIDDLARRLDQVGAH
jgi:hypothetical protein